MTNRADIVSEAMTWLRTPWQHRQRCKGAGVDCVMFLAEVYEAAGAIPHVEPEYYPIDIMRHRLAGPEPVVAWLEKFGEEIANPQPGDIVVYKFGHNFAHAAIIVDDLLNIIHAYKPYNQVVVTRIDEGLLADRPRLYYAFRGLT